MTEQPVRVPTRARINITEALLSLGEGETIRFPVGINYGSVRTIAGAKGIKVHLKLLESGQLEVTRRASPRAPKKPEVKPPYDL